MLDWICHPNIKVPLSFPAPTPPPTPTPHLSPRPDQICWATLLSLLVGASKRTLLSRSIPRISPSKVDGPFLAKPEGNHCRFAKRWLSSCQSCKLLIETMTFLFSNLLFLQISFTAPTKQALCPLSYFCPFSNRVLLFSVPPFVRVSCPYVRLCLASVFSSKLHITFQSLFLSIRV